MKKQYLKYSKVNTKGFWSLIFFLFSFLSFAQVTSSIDSTSIKIGEQITYKIEVETDTTNPVIFPEGQTFMPLEMIESYQPDTTKYDAKYKLIKKYGLTQFDSGKYVIPKQKIIIGGKTFATDSMLVEVNDIVVDTTKQKLYDVKPMIDVKKPSSNWWLWLLLTIALVATIGFLVYWFVWRKRPLTEEEKIAQLPPYDCAKLALKQLDETKYLERAEIKEYYSELTFIIRKYLDEKVYDKALESTTDQLIDRLNILQEGNQIELSKDDIKNIEAILKRADLVKFAKSAPDIELAKLDRQTVDTEIDQVKDALPEPSEEELLKNEEYQKLKAKKEKQKKIWITAAIAFMLLIGTVGVFSYKYGINYVIDTVTGKDTKQLLEGNWVTSQYGFPPMTISTPEVLKREDVEVEQSIARPITKTAFSYVLENQFYVTVSTTTIEVNPQAENKPSAEQNIQKAIEDNFKALEDNGARNILPVNDKFVTPNGVEGLKTSGTLEFPVDEAKEKYVSGQFELLSFASENVMQQVMIYYLKDDVYLDQVVERVLASVELKSKEE
ncbi:BatD family protein [Mesoflavibacter zeaxanthinifaciens]|uniref:BatD family protein n=1 Tax=Mesoflavibacter zeaxanthinifaciens TaxID=393060 RepID=UPI000415938E|nr:BatD family protein [Mesoflavibacter zeaxanthinifaciens]